VKSPKRNRSLFRRSGQAPLIAVALAGLGLSACSSSSASPSSSESGSLSVAATIINISGGSLNNSTVGVPSAQAQETDWNLVTNSINSSDTAGGHKLVVKFFDVNPIDTAAVQQTCLNIVAARPFLVIDSGVLTSSGASDCIPAHQIPLAGSYLTKQELTKYAPYYLNDGDIPEDAIANGIRGLKQLGWFGSSKGFKKLGIVHQDCTPQLYSDERSALQTAGVPSNDVIDYNLGCPAGQSDTPASMEQAVLSFKEAGVTDVTEVDLVDFALFTQVAAQQNYKPQYTLTDPGFADVSSRETGSGSVNAANLNGAVDVADTGYGEANTPGITPSGDTKRCDAIYSKGGQPSVYQQADGYGGDVCDYLWLVQALLQHDPSVRPSGLETDMHSIGAIPVSYPGAPTNFSAAPVGAGYGISYWRPIYFHASCTCFEVPNSTWHPPFS